MVNVIASVLPEQVTVMASVHLTVWMDTLCKECFEIKWARGFDGVLCNLWTLVAVTIVKIKCNRGWASLNIEDDMVCLVSLCRTGGSVPGLQASCGLS